MGKACTCVYAQAMTVLVLAIILGCVSTVSFLRSIRRERGERASLLEWFLSAEVGGLAGACAFALLSAAIH